MWYSGLLHGNVKPGVSCLRGCADSIHCVTPRQPRARRPGHALVLDAIVHGVASCASRPPPWITKLGTRASADAVQLKRPATPRILTGAHDVPHTRSCERAASAATSLPWVACRRARPCSCAARQQPEGQGPRQRQAVPRRGRAACKQAPSLRHSLEPAGDSGRPTASGRMREHTQRSATAAATASYCAM